MAEGYSIFEWLIFGLYLVISILAISGNSFICWVIYKKQMTSVTHILIANQAISDLLCGLVFISLWFFCSATVVDFGSIGRLSCECVMVLKLATFYVSAITMVVLAYDRYYVSFYPGKASLRITRTLCIIWAVGLVIGTWQMINFQITVFFTKDRLFGCRSAFKVENSFFKNNYNFGLTFFLTSVIPLVLMGVLYFKVIHRLREIEVEVNNDLILKYQYKENKRTTKMLIWIVVLYFAMGSPVYLLLLSDSFFTPVLPDACDSTRAQPVIYMVSYWMAVSANCVNPFVYCRFSRVFSDEFKKSIRWIFRREGHDVEEFQETVELSNAKKINS